MLIPLVASLAGIVPLAPHIAPMWMEEDYSDTAAHLADTRFVTAFDIPAHTADRVVCLVVAMPMVDSIDWAEMVVVVADSTD
jgi:hypothetical protein